MEEVGGKGWKISLSEITQGFGPISTSSHSSPSNPFPLGGFTKKEGAVVCLTLNGLLPHTQRTYFNLCPGSPFWPSKSSPFLLLVVHLTSRSQKKVFFSTVPPPSTHAHTPLPLSSYFPPVLSVVSYLYFVQASPLFNINFFHLLHRLPSPPRLPHPTSSSFLLYYCLPLLLPTRP